MSIEKFFCYMGLLACIAATGLFIADLYLGMWATFLWSLFGGFACIGMWETIYQVWTEDAEGELLPWDGDDFI
jgi:hypothetical protein